MIIHGAVNPFPKKSLTVISKTHAFPTCSNEYEKELLSIKDPKKTTISITAKAIFEFIANSSLLFSVVDCIKTSLKNICLFVQCKSTQKITINQPVFTLMNNKFGVFH